MIFKAGSPDQDTALITSCDNIDPSTEQASTHVKVDRWSAATGEGPEERIDRARGESRGMLWEEREEEAKEEKRERSSGPGRRP